MDTNGHLFTLKNMERKKIFLSIFYVYEIYFPYWTTINSNIIALQFNSILQSNIFNFIDTAVHFK